MIVMTVYFWGEKNKNGFLSNFYAAPIEIKGIVYPTTEHYFQSQKFVGEQEEEYIRQLATPKEAAREGKRRDFPLRRDWEEVKEDIMYQAISAKFNQHEKLKQLLLNTREEQLIEDSPFDNYWGVGRNRKGKNRLGILLMKLRNELGENKQEKPI